MLRRHLSSFIVESLRDFPVVLLIGARQVGKSTLVQDLAKEEWSARYLTLDDRAVLDAALTNPDGFLQELGRPVILDEVQRAPDLLRAVKLVVDRDRQPGMFLLTGSANILTMSNVSETLAGRVAVHELHPFSWAELSQKPKPSVIEDLFTHPDPEASILRWPTSSPERLEEIKDFIMTGGFPIPALMKRPRARRTWFDSYRQTYIERDLRDLSTIENLPDFGRLMVTLALRTSQMLNYSALSRDIGLPVTTLRRYFNLLEQTFQAYTLEPYHANVGKRLVKTPKSYLTDTGLACHLAAVDDWPALVQRNQAGQLIETWVAGELRKMSSVAADRIDIWYWRTRGGREVDFILERGGDLVGLEVKLGTGFSKTDLAGLKDCREAFGARWRYGILLYGGTEVVPLEDRLAAVPFGVFFGREAPATGI